MVMGSILGDAPVPYSPDEDEDQLDPLKNQPPPQANPANTGEVPFAQGQTPPVYGPPAPTQVDNGGINPNQGGFRGPENPANVTPGGQYAPNPDYGVFTPFHPINEAVAPYTQAAADKLGQAGAAGMGALADIQSLTSGGYGAGYSGPAGAQAVGGFVGSSLVPQSVEQVGLNMIGGGGVTGFDDILRGGQAALERSALEGLQAPGSRAIDALGGREAAAVQLHGGLPAGGSIDPLNHGIPDIGQGPLMAGGEPNAPGGRLYTPENEPYAFGARQPGDAAQQAYEAAYAATPSTAQDKLLNAEAARQEVLSGQTLPGNYSAVPQEGVMPNRNGTPLAYDPTFSGGSGYRETIAPPDATPIGQNSAPESQGSSFYHGTSPQNALEWLGEGTVPGRGYGGQYGAFVSDAPDMALGQHGSGALVELDRSLVNTREARPVGQSPEMAQLGTNHIVQSAEPNAVRSVTFQPDKMDRVTTNTIKNGVEDGLYVTRTNADGTITVTRRLEGGPSPEGVAASSSVSPPPPSPEITMGPEDAARARDAENAATEGYLNKPLTPAEQAGAAGLTGDARVKAMEDFGNTPQSRALSPEAQEFLNSPSGRAATAQRDALINTGLRPGETTTAATGGVPPARTTGGGATGGGGGVPPTGPAPKGINPNLWQQGMSAISAPTRVLLGFFPHSLRIGVQEIPTHMGAFVNAVKGMAEIYRTGKAPLADAVNHSFTGTNGILQNKGVLLSDMEAKFHPPATQYVNPTLAEKGLSLIPGLDRASKANFGYLNLFRDGIYNQAADFLARTTPNADKAMFEDLYLRASHGTGHSTLPGLRGNSTLGAAGLGPSALAARLQNTLDIFTKSGAPTPWSAGARGEAMRSLMGTAGVMALTSAVGYKLGAEVNLPFNLGPIKATDITNQNGLDSKLFKAVSTTPDLANKTVYGGGGGYDTLFRLFGNVGIDAMNGDHKALEGHVTSFLRGQAGVVPSIALDLLLGENWRGTPYGPRGGDKGMENFKGDLGQGFVNHWGPIAVKSLVDAYNAWGPGGLVRAAPSLGAYEVQTSPTTTTDQRNAVKDDARVPEPIRGVNPTELGPRGKDALDQVLKQDYPAAQAQAQANQKENENPVLTTYHDTVDKAKQQEIDRKTEVYNLLRDGKITGEQLRQGRDIINSASQGAQAAARNDPAYKDAVKDFSQNDVNKALNAYYQIGDLFKTPDGKPDWDRIHVEQNKFLDFVGQKNPETSKLLQFEVSGTKSATNPLDKLYEAAQPVVQKYFGDIKDPYARANERRGNPGEDAILNLLGYESKTLTPQAAQILQQARSSLPDSAAPVGARGQGVAAPTEAAAPAQAPPPQATAPPAPTGATLPPVVANDTQQRQNFVNAMSGPAHAYAQTTGIPPAVWAAMGASESNWGRAQSIFGIMGKGTAGGQNYDTFEIRPGGVRENTNSQFAAYNNLDDAFKHFVDLTSTGRYAPAHDYLMQTGDWQGFLHQINQAGYATAPNWADSIISLTHHIEQTYPGVR